MNYRWLPFLLELASQLDEYGPTDGSKHESISFINANCSNKLLRNIVIIGGGSCTRELDLLRATSLSIDDNVFYVLILSSLQYLTIQRINIMSYGRINALNIRCGFMQVSLIVLFVWALEDIFRDQHRYSIH